MKTKLLFLIAVFLFPCKLILAQTPTYDLRVDSMRLVDVPPYQDNAIEFGIYLTHTNAPVHFGYAGSQLFLAINRGLLPGCTLTDSVYCLKYRILDSDLPIGYLPRAPSISTATSPSQTVLRLTINAFQGTPGLDLTGSTDLMICRVRLTSIWGCFNGGSVGLAWRNPPIVAFSTKLFAYLNGVNTDITTSSTHSIDSSGLGFVWFGNCFDQFLRLTILEEGLYDPVINKLARRDTVKVYLRNTFSPYSILDSAKTFVDTINFNNKFIFRDVPSGGTYYIVAKHFNSLETWSKSGGEPFGYSDTTIYNFTTAITQAFGNNLKLKGTRYCIISGDVDQNGIVDGSDLSAIDNDAFIYGTGTRLPTDLDGNNFVEGSDLLIGDNNVGREVISP